MARRVDELFRVQSGDFHATKELSPGAIPLISCGETSNGLVGYFDIPQENVYSHAITVAYNGQPLTAKFHPYYFGAKDDVAVLIPRYQMQRATLLYIASLLNSLRWRYSYGRKCFREKLRNVQLPVPVSTIGGKDCVDEKAIAKLFPHDLADFVPQKANDKVFPIPPIKWHRFNILDIFKPERGHFHSIADLDQGAFMTVSRVSDDNGVVGYFDRPDGATVYPRGRVTVSTVGGDTFVQLDDFIATDNVVVCTPKRPLRITTLFFVAFMLNQQKWRYSYGRQCYLTKLTKINFHLPIREDGEPDEDAMAQIVEQTSYWGTVKRPFASGPRPTRTVNA